MAGTGMKMRELLEARRGCTPSACGRDSRKGPSLLAFIATAMAALGAIVPVAVVCYGATAVGSIVFSNGSRDGGWIVSDFDGLEYLRSLRARCGT